MAIRCRGTAYRALLPRLPRNLVVFDGRCRMSQARVRFALERNFNFFRMIPYFLGDEGDMAAQLDRHRLSFASLCSSEGEELRRLFCSNPTSGAKHHGPQTPRAHPMLPVAQGVVVLFVEKVPSLHASFLQSKRARVSIPSSTAVRPAFSTNGRSSSLNDGADELFQNPTTLDDSYASLSGKNVITKKSLVNVSETTMSTQALQRPEDVDLLVSANFTALCRIGMHLDRTLWRNTARAAYWLTPHAIGDLWFERFVNQRRSTIWGTSEEDVVFKPSGIEGLRERRWSWRTRYPLA